MSAAAPRFRTVIFDCDSTLSRIEGIEELSQAHRSEITSLTEAAMRGAVPLEQVYARRLALVRPTRAQVEALGQRYIEMIVPGARDVIRALREAGVEVRIVSGGLRPAVVALALAVGLSDRDVAAVDVHFNPDGEYAGFEDDSPLTRSGGKREMVASMAGGLSRPILFVGDGITDLETRPVVDCVAVFTGVVRREAVAAAADIVIGSPTLTPVISLVLGDATSP